MDEIWIGVDGMGGMGGIPIGTMGKGGVGREGTGRPEMGEISSTPSEIQSSAADEYILWKRNNLDVQLSIYRWPGYARRKMWLFSFKFDAMGNVNYILQIDAVILSPTRYAPSCFSMWKGYVRNTQI